MVKIVSENNFELDIKLKIIILILLITISIILSYYFHKYHHIDIIITHFFYLPIILSCIWFKKKGIIVALFLGVFINTSHAYFMPDVRVYDDYLRAGMFVLIAYVIAFLSQRFEDTEKLLIQKEESFRALAENANDGILIITHSGDFVFANKTMEVISGYKIDEFLKSNIQDFSATFEIRKLLENVPSLFENKHYETSIKRKDGRDVEIEITLANTVWQTVPSYLIIVRIIAERKKAEKILRESQKKLEMSEKNLKKFSQRILSIREDEKKRLSMNLHDELGSMVVALSSNLTITEEEIKDKNWKEALDSIRQTRVTLENMIGNLKKIAIDLMPPDLGLIGLRNALIKYFSTINKKKLIHIHFNTNLDSEHLDENLSIALYRVIQEALNNVLQHANARNVKIKLYLKEDYINLNIDDDGQGFKSKDIFQQHDHQSFKIGIEGMKERVEALKGIFYINSEPQKGCHIDVTIPIDG